MFCKKKTNKKLVSVNASGLLFSCYNVWTNWNNYVCNVCMSKRIFVVKLVWQVCWSNISTLLCFLIVLYVVSLHIFLFHLFFYIHLLVSTSSLKLRGTVYILFTLCKNGINCMESTRICGNLITCLMQWMHFSFLTPQQLLYFPAVIVIDTVCCRHDYNFSLQLCDSVSILSSKDQLALNLTAWWRLLLLCFQQGAQNKVCPCFPSITPAEEQQTWV